jgi:hypothetical protein
MCFWSLLIQVEAEKRLVVFLIQVEAEKPLLVFLIQVEAEKPLLVFLIRVEAKTPSLHYLLLRLLDLHSNLLQLFQMFFQYCSQCSYHHISWNRHPKRLWLHHVNHLYLELHLHWHIPPLPPCWSWYLCW